LQSGLLFDELAVLVTGAEIDLDLAELVAFEGEELRVAEFLAVMGDAAIEREGFMPFSKIRSMMCSRIRFLFGQQRSK
jgi:hypothetical protein